MQLNQVCNTWGYFMVWLAVLYVGTFCLTDTPEQCHSPHPPTPSNRACCQGGLPWRCVLALLPSFFLANCFLLSSIPQKFAPVCCHRCLPLRDMLTEPFRLRNLVSETFPPGKYHRVPPLPRVEEVNRLGDYALERDRTYGCCGRSGGDSGVIQLTCLSGTFWRSGLAFIDGTSDPWLAASKFMRVSSDRRPYSDLSPRP